MTYVRKIIIIKLYKAMVGPVIEYENSVWDPNTYPRGAWPLPEHFCLH